MSEGVIIDGAAGEGGGQILRTALSLSAVTGRPLRVARIRANRPKPGLAAQHLAAIRVLARACGAQVRGAAIGSTDLVFVPDRLRPVQTRETIGTAGATSLVLQAAALPLGLADGASRLTLTGGTHVPWSPTFDFLESDWVPACEATGLSLSVRLRHSGYYPKGGGEILALIAGHGRPHPISRPVRGNLKVIQGIAFSTNLPRHVPDRIAREARRQLRRSGVAVRVDVVNREGTGTGVGIHLVAVTEDGVRTGFSVMGDRDRAGERVARNAVNALFAWLDTGAALSAHLADQILLPLALADGPSLFTTSRVTKHLRTNAEVIGRFLPAEIRISTREEEPGEVRVEP